MTNWTIRGRGLGVHEASVRRYGSKRDYHISVYFLFTLVTVTCKYSIMTQLTYHFASYNSCSNWRLPASMQAWHRRTRFCRTLTNIPGVFRITGFTDYRFPTSNCSVEHPLWHGCARVAHCVTDRWRNFSHCCRPLRQYDVWFSLHVLITEKHWQPRGQHTVYRNKRLGVRHWTSREASLRHSSGWGTEAFPLSSVICAPVLYGVREASYSKLTRGIFQGAADTCTPMSRLHWNWWPSIWATVVRCKMVR